MPSDCITEILPNGRERPCRDDGDVELVKFFSSVRKADRDCNIEPPASAYAIMRKVPYPRREQWARQGYRWEA